MPYVKISELPSATLPLVGTELVEIVQSGVSKKVDASVLGGDARIGLIEDEISAARGVDDTLDARIDSIEEALAAGIPAQPFDVTSFYPGVPTASAILLRVPIARAVSFLADFAGAYGKASVAATASTVFDIQKNGISVGSMTFALGATTATFTTSGPVSFVAGDIFSIIGPATPDATLANIGCCFPGLR